MTRVLKWTAGGSALLALAVMALTAWWPGATSAQEGGDPTPAATAEAGTDEQSEEGDDDGFDGGPLFHGEVHGPRFDFAFGGIGWLGFGPTGEGDGEFLAGVAERLGISDDELRGAIKAEAVERFEERLQEAVEAGNLDQDEADAMLQALEEGRLDEYLREQARDRLEERLAEAVEDGRLTREEADERLEAFDNAEVWRFEGRRRGGADFHFFGFGVGKAVPAEPEAPSSSTEAGGA